MAVAVGPTRHGSTAAPTIGSVVRSHPVLAYSVVAFAVSWGGLLWLVGGPGAILGTAADARALFPAWYLVTVGGPSLAGVLLTGLADGRAGCRALLARLVRWRVGVRWYAVALLAAPLSVLAALGALSARSPAFVPGFLAPIEDPGYLAMSGQAPLTGALVVAVGGAALANAFAEELGWTGFVVHRLRRRQGVVAAGLVAGVLWGALHLVSNVWLGDAEAGPLPLVPYVAVLLFSYFLPFRVLMAWVYDRTESLLLAVLMHASLDVVAVVSTPPWTTGETRLTWYLAWAALLWIVVGGVLAHGGRPAPPRSRGR